MGFHKLVRFSLVGAVSCMLFGGSLMPQSGTTDESKRKVKSRAFPTYPELARRMNIAGKVKIEVLITPEGRVKSARIVGGHPLLVQGCLDAAKEWKFAPGPEETTQIVEFDFSRN